MLHVHTQIGSVPRKTSTAVFKRVSRANLKVKAVAQPPELESVHKSIGNGAGPSHAAGDVANKLRYQFGKKTADTPRDAYHGTAWSVRERLIDSFDKTHEYWKWVHLTRFEQSPAGLGPIARRVSCPICLPCGFRSQAEGPQVHLLSVC